MTRSFWHTGYGGRIFGLVLILSYTSFFPVRGLHRPVQHHHAQVGLGCLSLRGGAADLHALRTVRLEAMHKDLRQNERLACVGSTAELGDWELEGAREMKRASEGGLWTASLHLAADADVHYKYVVLTEPEAENKIGGFRELNIGDDAPLSFTVIDSLSETVRSLTGILPACELADTGVGKCRFELMVDESEHVAQVQVVGAHAALGTWREEYGIPLEKEAGTNLWVGTAELPVDQNLEYKFVVWREAVRDASHKRNRQLHIQADASKIHMSDNINEPTPLSTETTPVKRSAASHLSCLCKFDVEVDGAAEGTSVSLVGSHEFLGEWQTGSSVPMFRTRDNTFSASMHLPVNTDLQYKYLVKLPPVWDNVVRRVSLVGDLTVARETLQHHSREAPHSTRGMPPLSVHTLEEEDSVSIGKEDMRQCTFRLEQPEGFSESIGVMGDTAALGNWNTSHCLPMQAHMANGKLVFTASTGLEAGTRVNYQYVILHAPRWEARTGNRVITPPQPVDDWQGARRDNVRMVRRVRDIVGAGNGKHHNSQADEIAGAISHAIADDGTVLEAVGRNCYLETVDPSLCGTCLFKVDVEVDGLVRGDAVWMCGDDESLGGWQEGQGVKLVCLPHESEGGVSSHIWSAVVRLPAEKRVAYKYCVAYKGDSERNVCWEMGSKRELVTPANMRGAVFDRFESPLPLRAATDDDEAPGSEMAIDETQTRGEFENLAVELRELRIKYEQEHTLSRRLEKENTRLQLTNQELHTSAQPRLSKDTRTDPARHASPEPHKRHASPEPEKTATLPCMNWHPPTYTRETTPEWVQELGAKDKLTQRAAALKVQQYQAVVLQQTKEREEPQLQVQAAAEGFSKPQPEQQQQQHGDSLDESSVTSTPPPAILQHSSSLQAQEQPPQEGLVTLAPPLVALDHLSSPLQAQQQAPQVEYTDIDVARDSLQKMLRVDFLVEVHGLSDDDSVFLCGSHAAIGFWDPDQAVPMSLITDTSSACGVWRCAVALPCGQEQKYKYVVKYKYYIMGSDHSRDRWEPGNDRTLHTLHGISCDKQRVEDTLVDGAHLCLGHDKKLRVSSSSELIVIPAMGQAEQTQEENQIENQMAELDASKNDDTLQARGQDGMEASMEKMQFKSVLQETDNFLSSQTTQSSDGHQSEQLIRRNRMYKEHCQSVLSETNDESTRKQVISRLSALETAYKYASSSSTTSNAGISSLESDATFNDLHDSPFKIRENRQANLDQTHDTPGAPGLLQEGQAPQLSKALQEEQPQHMYALHEAQPPQHMKALGEGQPAQQMKTLQHVWPGKEEERQQMVVRNSSPISNSNEEEDRMQIKSGQPQQNQMQQQKQFHAQSKVLGEKAGNSDGRKLKEVHYSSQGSFMSTTTTTTTRVVYKEVAS